MLALQDEDGALFEGVPDADSSAAAAPEDVDRAAHAAAAQAAATSAGIGKFLNHIPNAAEERKCLHDSPTIHIGVGKENRQCFRPEGLVRWVGSVSEYDFMRSMVNHSHGAPLDRRSCSR